MSHDGAIRYSGYSTTELQEALTTIDRLRFPLNFVALQRELDARTIGAGDDRHLRPAVQGAEPQDSTKGGRPVLVWIIIIYYALVLILGIPSLVAATLGAIPFPEPFATYYASFDFWDYAEAGISFALIAAAIVALYRMKKVGVYLVATSWAYGLILAVFKNSEYESLGLGLSQTYPSRLVGLFVIIYLCYLAHRGRLT